MQQATTLAGPAGPTTPPGAGEVLNARWVASGVRSRVLVPLGIALLLVAVVLGALVTTARVRSSDDNAAHTARQVEGLLAERTNRSAETMLSLLDLLMKDRSLQAAMRAGDEQALRAATAPLMPELRARNGITHLDFHRADRSALLRTHDPAHLDDSNRFVLREAQRTGQPAWGNEQGSDGSYTLLVAAPWRVDGQLIGYTEMGIEFEQLVAGLRATVGADFFVLLDKPLFDRASWDRLQATQPTPVAWDEFPRQLMISRTTRQLPPGLRDYLAAPAAGSAVTSFETRWQGRYAHVIATPLENVRRQQVGRLVVLQDITPAALERRDAIAAVILTIGLIGGGLMLFFYVLLGRVQRDVGARTKRLKEAERVLATEQAERERAERELHLQQERNQLLEVRGRMVEQLAEANRVAGDALRENEEVTARLRQTQSELLAAAREAGRAEIATNVLHNVGNVLNSVNVSASVIGSTLRQSRLAGLAKGMRMMAEHEHELGAFLAGDDKGRKLPAYLQAATQAVGGEHEAIGEELGRLVKSIDHIKDIVATQQSHAASGSVVEPVQPTELAEDALRMQGSALARHQVAVVRDYEALPPLPLDRGRVLQILVNLISNAKAAMSTDEAGQQLILRVRRVGERLQFVVQDQGEGILPENLTRIFTHGFTTRRNGHGFGLHSSALAAREMGGEVTVASDGPGTGATFVLDLPLAPCA